MLKKKISTTLATLIAAFSIAAHASEGNKNYIEAARNNFIAKRFFEPNINENSSPQEIKSVLNMITEKLNSASENFNKDYFDLASHDLKTAEGYLNSIDQMEYDTREIVAIMEKLRSDLISRKMKNFAVRRKLSNEIEELKKNGIDFGNDLEHHNFPRALKKAINLYKISKKLRINGFKYDSSSFLLMLTGTVPKISETIKSLKLQIIWASNENDKKLASVKLSELKQVIEIYLYFQAFTGKISETRLKLALKDLNSAQTKDLLSEDWKAWQKSLNK